MRHLFPPRCRVRPSSSSGAAPRQRSPFWPGAKAKGLPWLIFVGYLLSPFTLWNDAFLNVPLSLVLGGVAARLTGANFFAASAVAYVFTNVLGLVLMLAAMLGARHDFRKTDVASCRGRWLERRASRDGLARGLSSSRPTQKPPRNPSPATERGLEPSCPET